MEDSQWAEVEVGHVPALGLKVVEVRQASMNINSD